MSNLSLWHLYFRGRQFIFPSVAQAEAGFFIDVDPVDTLDAGEVDLLDRLIEARLAQGNPRVPTPVVVRGEVAVAARTAGVRSWATFEKRSICWSIMDEGGHEWELTMSGRASSGGWSPGVAQRISKAGGASSIRKAVLAQLAERRDV